MSSLYLPYCANYLIFRPSFLSVLLYIEAADGHFHITADLPLGDADAGGKSAVIWHNGTNGTSGTDGTWHCSRSTIRPRCPIRPIETPVSLAGTAERKTAVFHASISPFSRGKIAAERIQMAYTRFYMPQRIDAHPS